MGLDVWEVIDAAATKPFGFMPFPRARRRRPLHPGRPVLPLLAGARVRLHRPVRRARRRHQLRDATPRRRAGRRGAQRPRPGDQGARVGVSASRSSRTSATPELARRRGHGRPGGTRGRLARPDPHVERFLDTTGGPRTTTLDALIAGSDAVVVVTAHRAIDWAGLDQRAGLVVDTVDSSRDRATRAARSSASAPAGRRAPDGVARAGRPPRRQHRGALLARPAGRPQPGRRRLGGRDRGRGRAGRPRRYEHMAGQIRTATTTAPPDRCCQGATQPPPPKSRRHNCFATWSAWRRQGAQGLALADPRPGMVADPPSRPAPRRSVPRLWDPHEPVAVDLAAAARRQGRPGRVVYDVIDVILNSNNYQTYPGRCSSYTAQGGGWVPRVDAVVTVNEAIADQPRGSGRSGPPTVLVNGQPRWEPPAARPEEIRRRPAYRRSEGSCCSSGASVESAARRSGRGGPPARRAASSCSGSGRRAGPTSCASGDRDPRFASQPHGCASARPSGRCARRGRPPRTCRSSPCRQIP